VRSAPTPRAAARLADVECWKKARLKTKPVKTVPVTSRAWSKATRRGCESIFGGEQPGYFYVGEPLDMDGIRIYLISNVS